MTLSNGMVIREDVHYPPFSRNPDVSKWIVFLGQRRVSGVEEFEASLSIVNIAISNMPGSNIALLQLAKPVGYNNYIQPLCVDLSSSISFPSGSRCWVAGWGKGNGSRGKFVPTRVV